jgi:hypothetical protein
MQRSKSIILCLAILGAACAAGTASAQAVNITGTEVFITHQWGNLFQGTATLPTINWDNIVVQDQSGTMFTIGFNSTTATGSGTYGTIIPEGPHPTESSAGRRVR